MPKLIHPPAHTIVIVTCTPRGKGDELITGHAYWTGRMWRGTHGFRLSGYRVIKWEKK